MNYSRKTTTCALLYLHESYKEISETPPTVMWCAVCNNELLVDLGDIIASLHFITGLKLLLDMHLGSALGVGINRYLQRITTCWVPISKPWRCQILPLLLFAVSTCSPTVSKHGSSDKGDAKVGWTLGSNDNEEEDKLTAMTMRRKRAPSERWVP